MASKQERVWLAAYLQCFNATEAARRAGYKWPNKIGPRKKQKFADEIATALEERVMSADEALVRMSEVARLDISPYVRQSEDGKHVWLDIDAMKADGLGHVIRGAYMGRSGPRVDVADPDTARKIILDHHNRAASGREDDPVHVKVRGIDELLTTIYGEQEGEDDAGDDRQGDD